MLFETPTPALAAAPPPAGPRVLRSLSCVVPCYNEAANLELLLPLLRAQLARLAPQWEIILVDDGSTDATAQRMTEWTRTPGVRALLLSRNFGKEAALCAGLEAAHGDAVVMLDSDMQHPPALLETFVRHWAPGPMWYMPCAHRDVNHLQARGHRWFYNLINRGGARMPPGAGDFRLMDRCVVDALMRLPERNRFMKGLYAWVGFESVAVPYVPEERAHGTSHFSKRRLVGLGLAGLTAFSVWPLRTVIAMGTVLALAALGYGAYLTLMYLLQPRRERRYRRRQPDAVCGHSVAHGVVAGGGARYEEVKGRPLYLVSVSWARVGVWRTFWRAGRNRRATPPPVDGQSFSPCGFVGWI